METLILSLLMVAGASATDSDSGSSGVRAQAHATARIIRGESVSFAGGNTRSFAGETVDKDQTFILPMAHSTMVKEESTQQNILEFH